ncbi:hypothetical protein [Labrenzia sp. OB1]|uniref:hypothetical protein n=1 Tax=Labrenzia sp. OB1 TaxID=1561204 RepID=UPI0007B1EBE9|nr:hypothetical protein [Labrenzia sp. OB1]KZM51577.1 hypothetical protein OA90_03830 [Labrenzia sp. OB1]
MSSSDDLPQILSFHALAATRGDGLHPLLAKVLARSGPVSGPPPPSEQNDANIVRPQFGVTMTERAAPSRKDAKPR